MKSVKLNLFPGARSKAVTMSYDDGIVEDKKLVQIFNKYGIKGTFNLNSGQFGEHGSFMQEDVKIIHERMEEREIAEVYEGHEVAVHTLNHPFLEALPEAVIIKEVLEDKEKLESIVGYPVRGMAYPYGTYDGRVLDILKTLGIEYSRTVESHKSFKLPNVPLTWGATCHHADPDLDNLVEKFVSGNDGNHMELLYIWGHSYEFQVNKGQNTWEHMEKLCEKLSDSNTIWHATNIGVIDYLNAVKRLKFSAKGDIVLNPSAIEVWITVDNKPVSVKPGQIVKL